MEGPPKGWFSTWFVVLCVLSCTCDSAGDDASLWRFGTQGERDVSQNGPQDSVLDGESKEDTQEEDAFDGRKLPKDTRNPSNAGGGDTSKAVFECQQGADIRHAPCGFDRVLETCRAKRRSADDADNDGLNETEEARLCGGNGSNPRRADTDDDGLYDCMEKELGTDACSKDSDGDGVDDQREVALCWEPSEPTNPGTNESWLGDFCPENGDNLLKQFGIELEQSDEGNWIYIASKETEEFRELGIVERESREAITTFRGKRKRVYGAIVAFSDPISVSSSESLQRHLQKHLSELGTIKETLPTRRSYSEPVFSANEVAYRWSAQAEQHPHIVRADLAAEVGGFKLQPSDLPDIPNAATSSRTFWVHAGLVRRTPEDAAKCRRGANENIVLLAVRRRRNEEKLTYQRFAADVVSPTRLVDAAVRRSDVLHVGLKPTCRIFTRDCAPERTDRGQLVYPLAGKPMVGTFQVWADGTKIPRDPKKGYFYRPSDQSLIINSDVWPSTKRDDGRDFVSVRFGKTSFTCHANKVCRSRWCEF